MGGVGRTRQGASESGKGERGRERAQVWRRATRARAPHEVGERGETPILESRGSSPDAPTTALSAGDSPTGACTSSLMAFKNASLGANKGARWCACVRVWWRSPLPPSSRLEVTVLRGDRAAEKQLGWTGRQCRESQTHRAGPRRRRGRGGGGPWCLCVCGGAARWCAVGWGVCCCCCVQAQSRETEIC
jgi:hypothetical protein